MSIKKDTFKNAAYGILMQALMVPLQFVSRWITLKYIGVEILGIGGTIASFIGMMSLADAGFGTAIMFSLFKPLEEHDVDRVNKLVNVFRLIYSLMAVFVLTVGVLLIPFLTYLLKNVTITPYVLAIYLIMCVSTASSYLLGYKRTLLYADMKEYISKKVDITCETLFCVLNLVCIWIFKNYIAVVLVSLTKTLTSNIIIHLICRKRYPYLKRGKIDYSVTREIITQSKNLFAGKLAAYVYSSTDNILISSFTGAVHVGMLSNYTLVSENLKKVAVMLLGPVTPAIGRLQVQHPDVESKQKLFAKYHQIAYLLAYVLVVPMLVLTDSFVCNMFGSEYVMSPVIKWLLAGIVYIYIAPFAYGDFITTSGLFQVLYRVEMVGAVSNLVISVIGVAAWGLPGVLLGTVISGTIQWSMRCSAVCRQVLQMDSKACRRWGYKEVYRVAIVVLSVWVASGITSWIHCRIYLLEFVIHGVICVLTAIAVYCLLYRFDDKMTVASIKELLGK